MFFCIAQTKLHKLEGNKGDKIPQAVDYILDKNIECDYLIRLDDDDIFNPSILRELQYAKFDIFVDRQQFFWNSETKQISNKTWYWFANTTIQKREHALQKWEDVMDMHPNKLYVITKDHSSIHVYYQDKKILFSKSKSPLYIRSISNSSITAYNASSKESYLNSFGNWSTNNLKSYLFLGDSKKKVKQTFYRKMINLLSELRFRLHYNRIVLNK